MKQIILASQSPRRKELLRQAGLSFCVCPADVEENLDLSQSIEAAVERLALEKAQAVASIYPHDIVIGADTIVYCDDQVMGKPHTKKDAVTMLNKLSGKTHQVISGVALGCEQRWECFHVISDVTFYDLSQEEILAYVESGEPLDKAGAYGIQGKGAIFVAKIVGDYYNIVGLPLAQVVRRLRRFR